MQLRPANHMAETTASAICHLMQRDQSMPTLFMLSMLSTLSSRGRVCAHADLE